MSYPTVYYPNNNLRITSSTGQRWGTTHRGNDLGLVDKNGDLILKNPFRRGGRVYCYSETEVSAYTKYNPSTKNLKGFGHWVYIKSNDGLAGSMAHMKEVFVKHGQKIEPDTEIGIIGKTGLATGVHTHFEVYTEFNDSNFPLWNKWTPFYLLKRPNMSNDKYNQLLEKYKDYQDFVNNEVIPDKNAKLHALNEQRLEVLKELEEIKKNVDEKSIPLSEEAITTLNDILGENSGKTLIESQSFEIDRSGRFIFSKANLISVLKGIGISGGAAISAYLITLLDLHDFGQYDPILFFLLSNGINFIKEFIRGDR